LHDLSYIDTPEYVSQKNRDFLLKFVPRAIKRAALIITISEFTKASIIEHYGVPEEKITITPIPPIRHTATRTVDLKRLGIKNKFILFISTLEPRKNIMNLVKAYDQLPESIKSDYSLVLAGGTGWYMDETLAHIEHLRQQGAKIILTGYVSDDEKTALYEAAEMFVMPSHYEGFGMPVLEAMAYGLPTAISDIPVFREVAGDASLFFDKDDPASISQAIQALLTDANLRAKLKKQGLETTGHYSWQSVVTALYERLKGLSRH
jgi:alpha-1,3-rhamnosyl/mannosyltransferase